MKKPIKFRTTHRANFSQIDPYGHMNTQHYLGYFLEHRLTGLRENLGLNLKTLQKSPYGFVARSVTIDLIRPVLGDEEFIIESFVTTFNGKNCYITCEMKSQAGVTLAISEMNFVCVDKTTGRSTPYPQEIQDQFFFPSSEEQEAV